MVNEHLIEKMSAVYEIFFYSGKKESLFENVI